MEQMASQGVDPAEEALGKVPLFSDLSQKEIKLLAGLTRPYSYKPGDDIVTQGDTTARFYMITQGEAAVLVHGEQVETLSAGSHFGEIAMLDGGPRAATVRALTPVETLSLASFSVRPVLRDHPDILVKLIQELCGRLRAAESSPTA
jgi:CRP-like cAMP-binding protein